MDMHRFSSRKRKQVRRACLNCQKAHSGCGEQRPCPRCVKRKEEHKCVDAPRRKRKDQPLESETEAITAPTVNKRKRKLNEPSAAVSVKTENSRQHKHSHHHDDEDYDDDACCSSTNNAKSIALAVRNNPKRPRRHNATTTGMAKWQQQTSPASATSFLSNNNTLSFPFDIKTEKQESSSKMPLAGDEYSRGYVVNTTTTHHNTRGSFGVMGQLQQNMLAQKFSLLQPQQTQRPQQSQYNKEVDDCPFMFNPLEFDCAVPPERQQQQQMCEMPPQQPQQQQQQPQQTNTNDDLSLEWLMPELYLWNTTTTTTTISAPPYMWGPDQQPQQPQQQPQSQPSYGVQQPQQQFMPQQLHQASSGSFLLDENLGGFSSEDPLFFSDYRTFEPLFSF